MWRRRLASALWALVLLALAGCGPADAVFTMPPLLVQGVLVDSSGNGLEGRDITFVLGAFHGSDDFFAALRSDGKGPAKGCVRATMRTGKAGDFEFEVPEMQRIVGFPALLPPGEETMHMLMIGLRTSDGDFIVVWVHGSKVMAQTPCGPDNRLVDPPRDYPLDVTGSALRAKGRDIVRLVVRTNGASR